MSDTNIEKKGAGRDGKKIVLSGIRATGNLHLGNYYGALSKFVRMQDDYDWPLFCGGPPCSDHPSRPEDAS